MKAHASAVVLLSWCALAPHAAAQVTPVPEFTGSIWEHFLTWHDQAFCLPDRVFGNTADLCSYTPQAVPITLTQVIGYWQGQGCWIEPKTWPAFGATFEEGVQYWTFDEPVRRFGGFWGTVYSQAALGMDLKFYDANLVQIGSVQHVSLACGVWQWAGWESTVPVKRIIVNSLWFPQGGAICMDAMQADPAPPGPTPCYANCDGSVSQPVLNIGDFTCFLTKFAGGDPYANCDGSVSQPALNIGDFTCFLTKFAGGCP